VVTITAFVGGPNAVSQAFTPEWWAAWDLIKAIKQ
jgi:hypothetical protein